jgi:precorrin-6B C5,15-methyltransferase / cobalt-precorrin-6B C5,C15-methyltransferase
VAIIPQPSAFSLAAARLGWPLADCATITFHGRPIEGLQLHLAPYRRILALSEDGDTPRAVAELLTVSGWGPSRLTVFAHLGGSRECVIDGDAQNWGARRVPDLNTLAIECRANPGARTLSRLAGLPDDAFEHDGQLTKREVRAVTLAALNPLPGQTLWDVGAGCGSIGIEWIRSGAGRAAIAIERDPARAAMIARNAASLGVPGLRIVIRTAPAALGDLPHPDAIFIGGGITSAGLLEEAWGHLPAGGRLVANAVTAQGEARLLDWHARHGGALVRIAVSRAAPVGQRHLWRPLAPVTQLSVQKPC